MRTIKEHPGRVLRGLKLRAYPTEEQEIAMVDMQRRLRLLWNWLVARATDTANARDAWACRNGAGPRPKRPETSEEQQWKLYKSELKEWRARVRDVLAQNKDNPEIQYRNINDWMDHFGVNQDYQIYPHLGFTRPSCEEDEIPPPAHLQQSLFKAYKAALSATKRGQGVPKHRKRDQDMLLQSGSGHLLKLGEFGPRPGCPNGRQNWLNAQVKIPGIGWISCRLGPEQPLQGSEFWLEGASFRREGDGWYASIRQHVIPQTPPAGHKAICGIDVGLVEMFAAVGFDEAPPPLLGDTERLVDIGEYTGDLVLASNTRLGYSMRRKRKHTPHGYVELIAERQAAGMPTSKLQCRAARHARQVVREVLFPFCDNYRIIAVENLHKYIGQQGLPHISFMRTIISMLIQRYGSERVREVDPTDTSRICSICGAKQDRSWSDMPKRIGTCKNCGHREHSDPNAARNVARRGWQLVLDEQKAAE